MTVLETLTPTFPNVHPVSAKCQFADVKPTVDPPGMSPGVKSESELCPARECRQLGVSHCHVSQGHVAPARGKRGADRSLPKTKIR